MKCEHCNYEGLDFYQFFIDKVVCPECKKIFEITEEQRKSHNTQVKEYLKNEKR